MERVGLPVEEKDQGKGDSSSRIDLANMYPSTPEKDELVKKSAFDSEKSQGDAQANTDKKSENVSGPI